MYESLFARGGLSLERLHSFLSVAERRGYAAAAPGNPTRQSQLCRQVGELEVFLGQALTERRGRGLVLTDAGERLATIARSALNELEQLSMAGTGAEQQMRLELGAGDSVLHWWVLPRVEQALARVPKVTLSLTSLSAADIVRRLEDARIDVGIVRADAVPKHSELVAKPLGSLEYGVFVRKDLMAKARAQMIEEVLARVPLALQHSEPMLNEHLTPFATGALQVALACETFPQACRAVRSGGYASLLPVLAREELPVKEYAELQPASFKKMATKMVLAWHPRLMAQRGRAAEAIEALVRGLRL